MRAVSNTVASMLRRTGGHEEKKIEGDFTASTHGTYLGPAVLPPATAVDIAHAAAEDESAKEVGVGV